MSWTRDSRPDAAGASNGPVEPAQPADLPGLADLMAASPLLQRYGTTGDSASRALASAREAGDWLLVCRATAGGPPAGFAWLVATRALNVGAYLRLLLVGDGFQGRGFGERLLVEVEHVARGWANHLYLLATTDNVAARRFYERHGFRHVGNLPDLVRPGIDEALYHKALRAHEERLAG